MWDQAFKCLIGENVYLETSFTFGYLEEDRFYQIMKKHDKDLIMVGSDSPWGSIKENIQGGKRETKMKMRRNHCSMQGGGAVYGLGFIGSAIYYISTATGFWMGVLGFLKALVWPAFLVYELLKYLGV